MANERVVVIEWQGRSEYPFHIHTIEKDQHGETNLGYDVDKAPRRFGGTVHRHCSSAGGECYLEHPDSARWWAEQGYEPKMANPNRRILQRPRGKYGPSRVLDSTIEDEGEWCDQCGVFVPYEFGCPHVAPNRS